MTRLRDAIYGFAVGDAMGLPYEYKERGSFTCTGMTGGGTWNQEKGTFSDDTSVLLATCASIKKYGRINCLDMMRRLAFWLYRGDYTPDGKVINVGASTLQAINSFDGINPICGRASEWNNGNGALMRMLPLAFIDGITDDEIRRVVTMTHAHGLAVKYCTAYVKSAIAIKNGTEPEFSFELPILSSAYVKDTFNSAIYAYTTTTSYEECVLKAINLGGDTDTIGALAGGLAGIKYGFDSIPEQWIKDLRRKDLIEGSLF
ncbi:MAG: ADP-ribosylglycohydrolase family protein [Bullifex sp.]